METAKGFVEDGVERVLAYEYAFKEWVK